MWEDGLPAKKRVSRGSLVILWMIIHNVMWGSEILVVGNRQDSQKESASEFSVRFFIVAGMAGLCQICAGVLKKKIMRTIFPLR